MLIDVSRLVVTLSPFLLRLPSDIEPYSLYMHLVPEGIASSGFRLLIHVRLTFILASLLAGQFFCAGQCSRVGCTTYAQVNQVYPPTLALSNPAYNLVGSKQVIYVQYGFPLALSLQPCTSLGMLCWPLHIIQFQQPLSAC